MGLITALSNSFFDHQIQLKSRNYLTYPKMNKEYEVPRNTWRIRIFCSQGRNWDDPTLADWLGKEVGPERTAPTVPSPQQREMQILVRVWITSLWQHCLTNIFHSSYSGYQQATSFHFALQSSAAGIHHALIVWETTETAYSSFKGKTIFFWSCLII